MFSKILIANRGEIACRVIRTARRLGVRTVAVFSDADSNALHVEMADEAVHIGPSEVSQSYLKGDRIIDAALRTGAQAIHPGYGFLSENPDFVEAVEKAGLVFIGPSADAIRAMGLKDAAKALMVDAGVPVVPGYHGENQDPAFLKAEASKIGYPVLIKARAGGGGKGMRLVEDPDDFEALLESAAREGQNAFGDPAVLVEKFITSPRHIEVQVFGDNHGNAVHLYERDCSLQRRHQKVIEEAPAPGMTADVRDAMTLAAVKAAKAINYSGAGTIEFIVDGSGALRTDGFWFMEMNTRLQVEHPVTEAITGQDLVEWQLRVAFGEPLPVGQEDIPLKGHAFEARLYAEDATKGFLPATGKIEHISFEHGRIDTGVRSGDEISPFYDPMIAKIITHGTSRSEALNGLQTALASTHVAGLTTNAEFLGALAKHDGFSKGEVDTGLIGRNQDSLIARKAPHELLVALAVLALSGNNFNEPKLGWRHWENASQLVSFDLDEKPFEARLMIDQNGGVQVALPSTSVEFSKVAMTDGKLRVEHEGRSVNARYHLWSDRFGTSLSLLFEGKTYNLSRLDPLMSNVAVAGSGDDVVAPMTGTVRAVLVKDAEAVSQGTPVIVLEAMKMEHTLKAPRDGAIAEVLCVIGDQVSDGQTLLKMEADNA